jgi:integrase
VAVIEKRTAAGGATSYRVKVRKGGHNLSKTFPKLKDAKRWAGDTEAAIAAGTFKPATAAAPTLEEAVTRYERDVLPSLAPEERKKRPGQLQLWRDRLGSRRLDDITAAEIAACRDKWLSEGLAPATVNRRLAALAAVYTAAVKRWHVLPASAHAVREVGRAAEHNERVRWLTDDERTRLLRAAAASPNPYIHLAVVLSLATGWRQSEIMGLSWDRVDLDRGWLTLEHSKNKDRRGVGVAGYALELLREFAAVRRGDTDLLFPSKTNPQQPMLLRKPWLAVLAEADITDFRWHDMRHDVASRLAMAGASLPEIGAVLGHRTPAMTKRYSHLSDRHITDVLAQVNKELGQ